jgi:serine/threonine protein kinase
MTRASPAAFNGYKETSMDLTPATILRGRYRITRLLGEGGMGAVYLAYDLALEHEVAVKINHNQNPASAAQFINEARLLATLRHPNLPRVIDYFLEASSQFLVMDYIPGDDLKSLVEQRGAFAPEQVLQWAEQLGSALSYLHRQNPPVFHRDVKPANLKLTAENEIILVDFGIAKAAEAAQATAAGASGFSPGYAPPEQYGTGRTGPYSDQYAMAATLFTLLTGQKPEDALQRVLGQVAQAPAHVANPTVPPRISLVLERAMALRPEDRFASIDDFMRALTDFNEQATQSVILQGVPLPQYPPPPPPLQAQPGGPVFSPAPPPALPVPYPQRRRPWLWFAGLGGLAVLAIAAVFLFGRGGLLAFSPSSPTAAVVIVASSTPVPPTLAPTPPPPTETPRPTATPTVTMTFTPVPTLTFTSTATSTLEPTATVLALVGQSRALAFVSDRGDGVTLQIWTAKVSLNDQGLPKAGDFTQLTFDPGDKQQPAWSPDGSRLLYVASGGKAANGQDLGLDIFLLDFSQPGAAPVNLTARAGDDTDPAWSPDGKQIAFTNNGRSDKVRMIDLMNADGSGLHRLSVDLEEFNPAWSPDGQWLVYVVLARDNNILYRRSRADDFASGEFFDNKAISGRTGQVASPAWSPDGSRIAYIKLSYLGEGRLMSMDAATRGDKIVQLTSSGLDRQPAWSPDSQWLAFTSRRDGNFEIYLMRATGQDTPVNLTLSPSRDLWPAWQP